MTSPYPEWCDCDQFVFWFYDGYDDDMPVCQCGHPISYHVDEARVCMGEVEVDRG